MAGLRQLATDELGLVDDRLRRDCWPLLLQIKNLDNLAALGDRKTLRKSKHAGQVKLDVDRSIKRFPAKMPESQRLVLQEQLMDLILWVLERENDLHYYQARDRNKVLEYRSSTKSNRLPPISLFLNKK